MVPISKGQMIIKDLGKISSCGKSVILNKQMIDTIKRNKIVNEVRDLLDKGFENIEIIIAENGFVINPSKVLKESNK